MKTLFLTLLASSVFAAETPKDCSYVLDKEAGWEDHADGMLTYKGVKYRCESIHVNGDMLTPCREIGSRSTNYKWAIAFDGAELDFFVFDGIFEPKTVCHNVATARQ